MYLASSPINLAEKALCLKAVQINGKNIRILMKNMENKIDKEICIAALKNKGCIRHVPYKFRDEELLKLTRIKTRNNRISY